jgi:hypothetical protein
MAPHHFSRDILKGEYRTNSTQDSRGLIMWKGWMKGDWQNRFMKEKT